MVHILSQRHPVHNNSPSFLKIHSNIIFPSTSMTSEWSLPFRFSDQNFVCVSHPPMRATYIFHRIYLDFIILITLVTCTTYEAPHSVVATFSSSDPGTFLSTLYAISAIGIVTLRKQSSKLSCSKDPIRIIKSPR
jgi:hypothetical protein